MIRTVIRAALVGAVATLIAAGAGVGVANAAPITCPAGQTATKVADGWDCVNNGGNPSNAEDPKNPNASKGDF